MNARRGAVMAKQELELTEKAFTELRKRYVDEMLAAQSPEQAYEGALAVRVLDSVRSSLESLLDTALIEEEADDGTG